MTDSRNVLAFVVWSAAVISWVEGPVTDAQVIFRPVFAYRQKQAENKRKLDIRLGLGALTVTPLSIGSEAVVDAVAAEAAAEAVPVSLHPEVAPVPAPAPVPTEIPQPVYYYPYYYDPLRYNYYYSQYYAAPPYTAGGTPDLRPAS